MPVVKFDVTAVMKDKDGKSMRDADGKDVKVAGELQYDFGANVEDAIKIFGGDVVFSNFVAQGKVRVQSVARAALVSGKTIAEAQEAVNDYKIGVAAPKSKKDHFAAAKAQFAGLDKQEQTAWLNSLQESLKK